jgi:hypothetical protein
MTMKFGRRIPKVPPRAFKFSRYLDMEGLPAAPATSDYTAKALPSLRDIMGNDEYGDCVLACGGHLVGVATGNAGDLYHSTLAQVLAQYTAIAGFDPKRPETDTGVNIIDALNYWNTKGFTNGTKSLGHLSIDATYKTQLKAAMWLFENLIFGVALPNTYVDPFPGADGFIWKPGTPNPNQGHCFLGVGHNDTGIKIDTWALFGTFTYEAIAELCVHQAGGEVYVLLTPDILDKAAKKAPNGIDWRTLVADFDAIGGTVTIPPPSIPPPPPAPAPGAGVTLAEAIAWAEAELTLPFYSQPQVKAVIADALIKHWPK